ncbi:Uncharacterised protein [Mycobacteroides abscessus subsp. abscessus]|nr:Uncharacterised protein [Mycobacteroides abscessus subsp. abscessus]
MPPGNHAATRPGNGTPAGRDEAAPPNGRRGLDRSAYRYWPVFDSVSMARLALAFLPVTSVRM